MTQSKHSLSYTGYKRLHEPVETAHVTHIHRPGGDIGMILTENKADSDALSEIIQRATFLEAENQNLRVMAEDNMRNIEYMLTSIAKRVEETSEPSQTYEQVIEEKRRENQLLLDRIAELEAQVKEHTDQAIVNAAVTRSSVTQDHELINTFHNALGSMQAYAQLSQKDNHFMQTSLRFAINLMQSLSAAVDTKFPDAGTPDLPIPAMVPKAYIHQKVGEVVDRMTKAAAAGRWDMSDSESL